MVVLNSIGDPIRAWDFLCGINQGNTGGKKSLDWFQKFI